MSLNPKYRQAYAAAISRHGMRATRQREEIFAVLMNWRDHPTADEIYLRARAAIPGISLATVYNCLDTLVACDLVKRLNYERQPSRYCPNHGEHAHFLDEDTGRIYDIELPPHFEDRLKEILPEGYDATKFKLSFAGKIRSQKSSSSNNAQTFQKS